ncbi:MAG TPA: glycosyltransferase family 39 protein [Vicinamibacterales bacterium]|nr:glycosyltransferase family 39 protein [Vicinamibacterales bacterium]
MDAPARPVFSALDIAVAISLAVATILVAGYFAPIGSNAGFVNMGHDGYVLREAIDLDHGAALFKDTYEQYGPLGPFLNLAGFRLLGRRLLAIKYAICIWYGLIAILLYLLARNFLDPTWSAISGLFWLSLAPFYQHGLMVSVHVYVLCMQTAATLALMAYTERRRTIWLAVAGLFCGCSCVLKQSVGFLFALAIALYFVARVIRRRSSVRSAFIDLSIFSAASVAVVAVALLTLAWKGALVDWYRQTILFPRQYYLGGGDEMAGTSGDSLLMFPVRFFQAHIREGVAYYWYVLRGILTCGLAAVVFRRSNDVISEKLILVSFVTLVLWAAAYPSPHYMHQWWTLSLGFGVCVYFERAAVRWVAARVLVRAPLAGLVTFAFMFVLLWPGLQERLEAAVERSLVQNATIRTPWVISGIKTDFETVDDFRILSESIQNYRQHHPGARLLSIDSSDGWYFGIAESLVWISLFDGNTPSQPIYWSMPVLSTMTYPDYGPHLAQEIQRTRPLLGEAKVGPFAPGRIHGYYTLLAIRTQRGYWYLYAPVHPESLAHGEQTRLVRVRRRVRRNTPIELTRIPAELSDQPLSGGFERTTEPSDPTLQPDGTHLYTWPPNVDPPDRFPENIGLIHTDIKFRADIVHIGKTSWTVNGQALHSATYLLESGPSERKKGQWLVMRGKLIEGGFSAGLQAKGEWVGQVTVGTPGIFTAALRAPYDEPYEIVVSNDLHVAFPDVLLPFVRRLDSSFMWNHFVITSVGWTAVQ